MRRKRGGWVVLDTVDGKAIVHICRSSGAGMDRANIRTSGNGGFIESLAEFSGSPPN